MKTFHILNGDSLREQFPEKQLGGEIIVMRECLVDGDVSGHTLEELFETRAASIQKMYGSGRDQYFEIAAGELLKIKNIEEGEVNLWFEDDLFCQVNFWFSCSLLTGKKLTVNFVRPETSLQYGFAGLDQGGLINAFKRRQPLKEEMLRQFSSLWTAYQKRNNKELEEKGKALEIHFPFLAETIRANTERTPDSSGYGRPERILLEIISEKQTHEFGPVFKEFCKREAIYGFGDLQVKRLFDGIIKK